MLSPPDDKKPEPARLAEVAEMMGSLAGLDTGYSLSTRHPVHPLARMFASTFAVVGNWTDGLSTGTRVVAVGVSFHAAESDESLA